MFATNSRGGGELGVEYKAKHGEKAKGGKISPQSTVSLGPHLELLVFSAAKATASVSVSAASLEVKSVFPYSSYLSAFSPRQTHTHTHTRRATPQQNKLLSWKQYALADALASLEMKCPTTHCFQAQGSNKKRLLLLLMFTQANVFWPAVILSLFSDKI